jgi:hypothetical protein
MTQEEIEALMNDTIMDSSDNSDEHNIDDLLAGIDGMVDDGDKDSNSYDGNIDDLLASIDGIVNTDEKNIHLDETDMDALLAGIDGMVDDKPVAVAKSEPKKEQPSSKQEEDSINVKIDKGIYPMPVEKEHKVVNQLNEVAEDSEEKASQIFDVLSFILDENDLLQRNTTQVLGFIDAQTKLLETLCAKFPSIDIFNENLQKAKESKKFISEITSGIEDENNKVFEAMELMQYHDINRQKIERVMAVIRKLSLYLSGLFEDDSNKPEVQIAKHISGDSSQTVSDDDLDSLIAEFSKEV